MHNNSSPKISSTTKGSYRYKHKTEVPYMITEGRIEHLEQIAGQIEKYEKWDLAKMFMSGCGAFVLFGLGILIPVYLQIPNIEVNPVLHDWIKIFTLGASFGFLVSLLFNHLHNKERQDQYSSEAKKIKDLLNKVKLTVDQS